MHRGYRSFTDFNQALRYEHRLKKLAKNRGWQHWALTMRSNAFDLTVYLTVHTPRSESEAAIGYPSQVGIAGKI